MIVTIRKNLNYNKHFIYDLARNSSQIFKTNVHFVFILKRLTKIIEDNLIDCDIAMYIQSKYCPKFETKQYVTLGFSRYEDIAKTIMQQDESIFHPLNPNELKCILFPDGEDALERKILLLSTS